MVEDLDGEIWKDVPKYENMYQVSNLGRVLSLDRNIKNPKGINSYRKSIKRILRQNATTRGYMFVTLHLDGKPSLKTIHRLVALAFLGESYLQVDHIDGDKKNNNLMNLRYCNNRENQMFYSATIVKSSKYFGVDFVKKSKKWRARIRINGSREELGEFTTELDAHNAYKSRLKSHLYSITRHH